MFNRSSTLNVGRQDKVKVTRRSLLTYYSLEKEGRILPRLLSFFFRKQSFVDLDHSLLCFNYKPCIRPPNIERSINREVLNIRTNEQETISIL
jgi:hypothetical protein